MPCCIGLIAGPVGAVGIGIELGALTGGLRACIGGPAGGCGRGPAPAVLIRLLIWKGAEGEGGEGGGSGGCASGRIGLGARILLPPRASGEYGLRLVFNLIFSSGCPCGKALSSASIPSINLPSWEGVIFLAFLSPDGIKGLTAPIKSWTTRKALVSDPRFSIRLGNSVNARCKAFIPALEAIDIELLLVGISARVFKSCGATGTSERLAIKTPKFSIVGFNHLLKKVIAR
jgi:hypothetical protein